MSEKLLTLAKKLLHEEMDSCTFADDFICQWKAERDAGLLGTDNQNLSEALSSIFCLADMFNPDDDRESYELDEVGLHRQVRGVLQRANLI